MKSNNPPAFNWQAFIQAALQEDIGSDDHTSQACIPEGVQGHARLLVKEACILAGVELAEMIFHHFDPEIKVNVILKDGSAVREGDIAFTVQGPDRHLLTAERLVLNCMQRMSGVATLTHAYVEALEGTGVKVLDTRKTTPLLRALEKWAVQIGGGENHRFGLYDMIMIKDNNVDYAGGISQAIERVKEYLEREKLHLKIEVETRNISEIQEVLQAGGVDRIMLDNFRPEQIPEAVELINKKAEIEVSGGIRLENIRTYAVPGVNYISVGALTNGYHSPDMSLKAVR